MISYQYGTGLDAQGSTMDAAGKLPRSRCRTAYKSSIYEGAWQEWREKHLPVISRTYTANSI